MYAVDLLRTFVGVNPRSPGTGYRSGCPFQFFIDGVAVKTPKLDTELPSPKDLAGIELYTNSATVPLQYKTIGGGGFCGVVLEKSKSLMVRVQSYPLRNTGAAKRSIGTLMQATRPAAWARARAAGRSAACATCSPWAPNARATSS